MIKFDKLFARLKAEGKPATRWLRETGGMHPNVVNRMRRNETVTTETIDRVCQLLHCQPGDILEYADENE